MLNISTVDQRGIPTDRPVCHVAISTRIDLEDQGREPNIHTTIMGAELSTSPLLGVGV